MCGVFKGTVSISAYGVKWYDELSNNEQARTQMETIAAQCDIISRNLHGGTEENSEKHQEFSQCIDRVENLVSLTN